MFFLFGERVRSAARPQGEKLCPVCTGHQPFTEQLESLWFSLFHIPVLKIEDKAHYWRCENCMSSFSQNDISKPSHVPITQQLVVYILLGYGYSKPADTAREICLKVTGFELTDQECSELARRLSSGHEDMVQLVRDRSPEMNLAGKQAVLGAAFLATYVCCDLQYEDRLRINLIGNALGVGLDFVEYALDQVRKQGYLGVRRLSHSGMPVR